MGMSFDWSRRLHTSDPGTPVDPTAVLRLFEKGLAYRKESPVNWCPKDATVLANEQVIQAPANGGTPVERRNLTQWFFRITDYAQRLLDDARSSSTGPSGSDDAAELDQALRGRRGHLHDRGNGRRSSRPGRTLWGATFFVFAVEHRRSVGWRSSPARGTSRRWSAPPSRRRWSIERLPTREGCSWASTR
jgi:leucyl-tRNA synthetase